MDAFHPHHHLCDPETNHRHDQETRSVADLPNSRIQEQRKLLLACLLTGGAMIIEGVGGLITNSLALLSDAGHMLTHFLALGVSLLATHFSNRPPTDQKTFGFYRLEILAALFNGITLFIISGWIFYYAYLRVLTPVPIDSLPMFLVALFGLGINILTVFILNGSTHGSLNIRSAFFHVIGDTLSSVAVVIGAIVIYYTDWLILDPILSVLICLVILIWAVRLINESVNIFLEATPKEINIKTLINSLHGVEGVMNVHDLHVWTLTSGMYALSAHVAIRDVPVSQTTKLLKKINFLLCQEFNIGHTAIQFELQEDAQEEVMEPPSIHSLESNQNH